MNRWNQFGGLFWLIIAIIVCIESIRAHIGTFQNPGAGFLPFCAGVALGIFAMILFTTSILKTRVEGKAVNPFKRVNWRRPILLLIPLFLYSIFLPWLGYLIATFGLMLFLFVIIERSKFWIEIMIALITVSVTYLVFYRWLGIQLPRGIFGF